MAKIQIEGIYQSSGSKLIDDGKPFILILDQRKNVSHGKPPSFLVAKSTSGTFQTGKKDQYISSVYPVPGQTFSRIEFEGIQYKFEFNESGAVIKAWSQMALNNNSHL
jgi:hypothetical protein